MCKKNNTRNMLHQTATLSPKAKKWGIQEDVSHKWAIKGKKTECIMSFNIQHHLK
jgi:hypothetical protein